MEVILNYGDKINIPDGCKAEIKDGVITIEKNITKIGELKEGDFFVCTKSKRMGIIKNFVSRGLDTRYYITTLWDNYSQYQSGLKLDTIYIRHATEEERKNITAKMAEQGLRWNAEKKELEQIRWRAKEGEEYCYVGNQGIIMVDKEDGHCADKNRHDFGNYFRTQEQAEKAAELIKATLKKFHEDYESNK